MTKFKIGDRVAAYTFEKRYLGTIDAINDDYVVIFGQTAPSRFFRLQFHNKQCRKLVKKPRRRRIWVNEYPAGLADGNYSNLELAQNYKKSSCVGTVEFVEVRPKKGKDLK